ncbi:DNA-methyltransferase [Limnochorda pilosa]|uniref:Methyltransferase n=1 Tax=Limnochorda pilosa TaxID=1555112 RepID=A0A0K2SQJ4_LIMPI|nr:site-specific DNA-methyltransferase [Limnochorda pilosa]BAS29371.1 DNA methyltransferase [Limnochorda pilosa]
MAEQIVSAASKAFLVTVAQAKERLAQGEVAHFDSLIHGDCLDVLPAFPANSVDLIHTSPPYNIGKAYKSVDDDRLLDEYIAFLESVVNECYRVLKPDGSFFFQTGYSEDAGQDREIVPIDMLTYRLFRDAGFRLWDRVIWYYFGGMSFARKFKNNHETILWWVKPGNGKLAPYFDVDAVREQSRSYDKRNNLWGKNPGNVWIEDRVAFGGHRRVTSHIAIYPESVTERIIRACSRPGEVVLDPFAGSGTTPAVARSLGRSWVGIEISEEYALESAFRLGTKQRDELHSLGSGLVKIVGFDNRPRQVPLEHLMERVKAWVQHLRVDMLRETLEKQLGRLHAAEPSCKGRVPENGMKELKPDVWAMFDGMFSNPPSGFRALVEASAILDALYPQRSRWNGIRRYSDTLDLLKRLWVVTEGGESLDGFLARVLEDEPSSYETRGKQVVFNGPPLQVTSADSGSGKNGIGQGKMFS